jgi:hypothetical protein
MQSAQKQTALAELKPFEEVERIRGESLWRAIPWSEAEDFAWNWELRRRPCEDKADDEFRQLLL